MQWEDEEEMLSELRLNKGVGMSYKVIVVLMKTFGYESKRK